MCYFGGLHSSFCKIENLNNLYKNHLNTASPSSPRLLQHNPALDALRGIAVTLVFLFHAGIRGFSGAFIGVDIFFVLSGFLITLLILQEYQGKGSISLKKFYMRRILRLIPALVFMLAVYLTVINFRYQDAGARLRQLQDAFIVLFYAANWTRAFDLGRPDILGHTWSLSIEEQFYMLWPFSMLFLLRFRGFVRSILIAAMFFASWAWRLHLLSGGASWNRLYNGLDCRADMLLAGCLLASLWHAGYLNFWDRWRPLSEALVVIACIGIAVMCGWGDWEKAPLYLWQYPLVALAAVIVILEIAAARGGLFSRALNTRWLVWPGKISYGIYLWHYPVIALLDKVVVNKNLKALTAALLTMMFAVISWYAVERPFLRLKRRFT